MNDCTLIKGYLESTDIFSDELISALYKRDIKTSLLNKKNECIDTDGVIAFNNLGYSLDIKGKYIDILMDHPFNFHSILNNLPKNTYLYCIDRNHVKFVKKHYPKIKHVGFLPHGGCSNSFSNIPETERDIDILYAGNLSKSNAENLIPDFDIFEDIDGALFSGEVLKALIQNPDTTTEDMICKLLGQMYSHIPCEDYLRYINAFRFIDGFAVSYYRELSVRILVENGFKVHVLGKGWDECDWVENPNLVLMGKVSPYEVLLYMKRSKIVLNTLTWFKDGAHDRIFNGMLAKATVLTDTSGYLLEEFSNGENICFFDLKDITRLPYIVRDLFKDNERLEYIAEKGFQIASKYHTWENRLNTIMGDI